jgi:hypothetical protein
MALLGAERSNAIPDYRNRCAQKDVDHADCATAVPRKPRDNSQWKRHPVGSHLQPLTTARERYVSAYDVATVYAALDDAQTALDWLERAMERRDPPIPLIGVDPAFDSLYTDPRFVQVVAKLHRRRD